MKNKVEMKKKIETLRNMRKERKRRVKACVHFIKSLEYSHAVATFAVLLGVLPRTPRAVKRLMTTPVWYLMLLNICALPFVLFCGLKCPSKKGPMMRMTANVAPAYFIPKSCTMENFMQVTH